MNELNAPELHRFLDPSLDSVLMDCPAAVDLLYMQVRVTEDSQNTDVLDHLGLKPLEKICNS